jgi:hypothetical protein
VSTYVFFVSVSLYKIMKRTLISNHFSLAVAAGLALSTISNLAQDVAVTGSLTYVAAGGGVFDYTLTLHNTGSEAVEGLCLGWALSSSPVFNVFGIMHFTKLPFFFRLFGKLGTQPFKNLFFAHLVPPAELVTEAKLPLAFAGNVLYALIAG